LSIHNNRDRQSILRLRNRGDSETDDMMRGDGELLRERPTHNVDFTCTISQFAIGMWHTFTAGRIFQTRMADSICKECTEHKGCVET
jgi:hypothetical protein